MNITEKQKQLLEEYNVVLSDDIDSLLLDLDDKITEIGFDEDYKLNEDGHILQRLYDQIYNQN
jgi:hypothetical protein